jgi:hypothetical protein
MNLANVVSFDQPGSPRCLKLHAGSVQGPDVMLHMVKLERTCSPRDNCLREGLDRKNAKAGISARVQARLLAGWLSKAEAHPDG